jgi:hypothetical protein
MTTNKIFDIFSYQGVLLTGCPNCGVSSRTISATDRSIKITCDNCKKHWFYRRVDNF